MSRVIADGLSKRVTATTQEAQDAVESKYPDAAGVHAAFNQYGLGVTDVPLYVGSLSDINNTSFLWSASTNLDSPIGDDGFVVTMCRADTIKFQWFYEYGGGKRTFHRIQIAGNYGAWQEIYHQGSILGTVSQSAGVPTGAIIEAGSNANGEYTKLADGTVKCWGVTTTDIFFNSSTLYTDLSLPVSILKGSGVGEGRSVSVTRTALEALPADAFSRYIATIETTINSARIAFNSPSGAFASGDTVQFMWTIEGRWY